MLQNDPLVSKIGFDTAENRLPKDTYVSPYPNLSKLSWIYLRADESPPMRNMTFRAAWRLRRSHFRVDLRKKPLLPRYEGITGSKFPKAVTQLSLQAEHLIAGLAHKGRSVDRYD